MNRIAIASTLIIINLLIGCKKEEDPTSVQKPENRGTELVLNVSNMLGAQPLVTGPGLVPLNLNDTVSILQLAYYISNVTLIDVNNNEVKVPNSFHLINQGVGKSNQFKIALGGLPEGTYKSVKFTIGVDSSKNFSLDNTGDLDPNNFMAWNWNTGYKFFLLEGFYYPNPSNPSQLDGMTFHVGNLLNLKTITLSLQQAGLPNLDLVKGTTSNIYLKFNLSNAFKDIDLTQTSTSMGGATAAAVANGYSESFSLTGVFNP